MVALGGEPVVSLPDVDKAAQERATAAMAAAAAAHDQQHSRPDASNSSTPADTDAVGQPTQQQQIARSALELVAAEGAAAQNAISDQRAQQDGYNQHPGASDSGQQTPGYQTEGDDGVLTAAGDELRQLRESYLLLQEEYWRQKNVLLSAQIEAGQLRSLNEEANRQLTEVRCKACRRALCCAQCLGDVKGEFQKDNDLNVCLDKM